MKKEYQKPTTFIIPITAAAEMMVAGSSLETDPNPGDEFGVKEENSNTTNGGSIWDNEW